MELYKKEKVNPLAGLVPTLVQLPVLFAIFKLFRGGLGEEQMASLYSFIAPPLSINSNFLGIIDLAKPISEGGVSMLPNIILLVLVGILQILQAKMNAPKTLNKNPKKGDSAIPQFSEMMQKQMLYFFPFFTLFILWKLPAVIALYFLISSSFSCTQQYLVSKKSA